MCVSALFVGVYCGDACAQEDVPAVSSFRIGRARFFVRGPVCALTSSPPHLRILRPRRKRGVSARCVTLYASMCFAACLLSLTLRGIVPYVHAVLVIGLLARLLSLPAGNCLGQKRLFGVRVRASRRSTTRRLCYASAFREQGRFLDTKFPLAVPSPSSDLFFALRTFSKRGC